MLDYNRILVKLFSVTITNDDIDSGNDDYNDNDDNNMNNND